MPPLSTLILILYRSKTPNMSEGRSLEVRSLKVLSFNVEGLDSMLLDPNFMELAMKHDICLLSETMRKEDSKLNLPGFWDFSIVRPKCKTKGRNSGGITVLVKSPLRSGIKIMESSEGLVWLRLRGDFFNFTDDLYICAVYIPPQSTTNNLAKRTDYFADLLFTSDKYKSKGNVLLAGDFNARVGCESMDDDPDIPFLADLLPKPAPKIQVTERTSCDQVVNQNGRKLMHLCKSSDLKIANGRCPGDMLGNFTCFANKGASVVDYIITDCHLLREITSLKLLPPDLMSVHSPITMSLTCNTCIEAHADTKALPLPAKVIWDGDKSDFFSTRLKSPEVSRELQEITLELQNEELPPQNINLLTKRFTNVLVTEAKSCMKVAKISNGRKPPEKKTKAKSYKWYDKNCINLKKRLQNLSKLLQKNPKEPYIRGQHQEIKKEYRKSVKRAKQTYEEEVISNLQAKVGNPKEFWSCLKNLGRKTECRDLQPSSDQWVEHFSTLYTGNHSVNDPDSGRISDITEFVNSQLEVSPTHADTSTDAIMALFSIDEIKGGIKRLKKGKAVAEDLLSNDMIIASAEITAPILVHLFNRIIQDELPPEIWCLGIIIPLFKSGDSKDVNNYRGITINSCLSKLFMLLMNDRLQVECDKNGLIHFNQIGFRKHFRPADHVFTLKTLIDQAFSQKKQLYTCFVDFKKAYDSVWRYGLFYKLLQNGISQKFVRLLRNIYSASSLCVKLPNGRSIEFPSKVGLKQGCNLSPLLFNLFVNDFLTEVNEPLNDSPLLGEISVNALFYADDLVLVSESKEGLQMLLDRLHQYTQAWCLQVNKSKTKCLVFSTQRKRPVHIVNFGGAPLVTTESYCYLGTIFSRNGSLNEAGHMLHDKAIKAMHGLLQKVYKFKSCDPKIMLDVFDKMVMPIALYNSEMWGTSCFPVNEKNTNLFGADAQKNPVEDVQIRFCRRLLGVNDKTTNWAVTTELGRYPTILLVAERMIKFWAHLIQTSSPILKAALQTNVNLNAKGKRVWFTFMRRCMAHIGIDHILYTSDLQEINLQVNGTKRLLRANFLKEWEAKRSDLKKTTDSKVCLLSHMKIKFGYEDYLSVCPNQRDRMALSKFRVSAHNLPVEVGRYAGTTRENRICPFCSIRTGDEQHYLCECPNSIFSSLRDPLHSFINSKFPDFNSLDPIQKTIFILGNTDPKVISKVARFCNQLMTMFREHNTRTV